MEGWAAATQVLRLPSDEMPKAMKSEPAAGAGDGPFGQVGHNARQVIGEPGPGRSLQYY